MPTTCGYDTFLSKFKTNRWTPRDWWTILKMLWISLIGLMVPGTNRWAKPTFCNKQSNWPSQLLVTNTMGCVVCSKFFSVSIRLLLMYYCEWFCDCPVPGLAFPLFPIVLLMTALISISTTKVMVGGELPQQGRPLALALDPNILHVCKQCGALQWSLVNIERERYIHIFSSSGVEYLVWDAVVELNCSTQREKLCYSAWIEEKKPWTQT